MYSLPTLLNGRLGVFEDHDPAAAAASLAVASALGVTLTVRDLLTDFVLRRDMKLVATEALVA